jgi:hypothetical protein
MALTRLAGRPVCDLLCVISGKSQRRSNDVIPPCCARGPLQLTRNFCRRRFLACEPLQLTKVVGAPRPPWAGPICALTLFSLRHAKRPLIKRIKRPSQQVRLTTKLRRQLTERFLHRSTLHVKYRPALIYQTQIRCVHCSQGY